MVGSPEGIYQPGWDVTNRCRLDTANTCQDVVDHIVPTRYFFELRHMPNVEFLSQCNKNLAQQVAMGSQLRLRFEQEEVHGLQNQTSNLKTLLEAEADMKKAAEAKNADLTKELESLHTQFLDLHEELYPHMLIAIAGRRCVIGHDLCLAVMKCAESIELRQAFANVVSMRIAKAYDPEANSKYLQALQELKDPKYPIEVIMASLHLESDSEEDAPKWIRNLRPSTSQLKILVYPKVRDPRDPWAVKEEMLLEEVIAANVSRAEKKKRCQVVCHTHGVGSAHHARSDGVPVSVPTVALQGLAILLADAATQIKTSEEDASPRLLRSKSLPPMYNLDWP
nr:hypothetical protein [Tanacetum cinerariifolium]